MWAQGGDIGLEEPEIQREDFRNEGVRKGFSYSSKARVLHLLMLCHQVHVTISLSLSKCKQGRTHYPPEGRCEGKKGAQVKLLARAWHIVTSAGN